MASTQQQDHKHRYSPKIAIPIIALTLIGSLSLVLMIVLWG